MISFQYYLDTSSTERSDFAPPCQPYTTEQLEQELIREVVRWSNQPFFDEDTVELLVRLDFRRSIERVVRLVKNEHKDQTRWELGADGQPLAYTVHLFGAALRALRNGEDGMVVCGILTHDLLEDTRLLHLKELVLTQIFQSKELVQLTHLLSKVRFDESIYGSGESYTDTAYYTDLGSDLQALRVKGYDRQDNLASFGRLLSGSPAAGLPEQELLARSERNVIETQTHLLPLFRSAITSTEGQESTSLQKIHDDLAVITQVLVEQIVSTRSGLTKIF